MPRFFDPHPGFTGCLARLPETVRKFADSLDGQTRNVEDVVADLQKIADKIGKEFSVKDVGGSISLTHGSFSDPEWHGPINTWRVIRYESD